MDEQLFERVLAGEHGEDLSPAEAEAFEAWLDSERGRELLAAAEGELDPLADAFDPADPGPEAWARVEEAIRAQAAQPIAAAPSSGVVVTPPQHQPQASWGFTALVAAGLLFVAAIGLMALGPQQPGGGTDSLGAVSTRVLDNGAPERPSQDPFAGEAAVAPAEAPAATVADLEAGAGYQADSELIDQALLVITISAQEADEER